MTIRLNPYLSFTGQAREALDFYASVLGGTPQVMTFGDAHMEGMPAELVMHGQLDTPDGFTLMASDTPEDMQHTPGSTITISLSGDEERMRAWFDGLAEGGTVTMPLEKMMWGAEFGQFTDRFGINWMMNLGSEA